jgi:hypothetical protein
MITLSALFHELTCMASPACREHILGRLVEAALELRCGELALLAHELGPQTSTHEQGEHDAHR